MTMILMDRCSIVVLVLLPDAVADVVVVVVVVHGDSTATLPIDSDDDPEDHPAADDYGSSMKHCSY